jgi:isoquinoline 1-oxidoreductase beta subunit
MSELLLSRRQFLKVTATAAGGMLIGFHLPPGWAASVQPEPWTALPEGVEINAWLAIDADGNVTIRVPHTDMGQGALTSVAMMIAEELDVEWSRVRAVFADANRHLRNNQEYVTMFTAGSAVVRRQHPHIMQAGASARERLKEAAARAWGVERSAVEAKLGVLTSGTHKGTYGEFASAAAAVTLAREPDIKTPDQWWLLGTPLKRLDVDVKSTGRAVYAIDAQVPGMVYAAVKACPVPWGRLVRFDAASISDRPGIVGVYALEARPGRRENSDLQDAVAVVADSWWRAQTALDQLQIEWDYGPAASVSTESQLAEAKRRLEAPGELVGETSSATDPPAGAQEVTAEYYRPYETHARMEPINATVSVTSDRVDVWSPTQDQSVALQLAADQAGVDPARVFVHTTFLGGGFGGNGGGGTAVTRQATELSKRVGRPVKVIWSREEDIAQDKQRPPNVTRFRATLDPKTGLPSHWSSRSLWYTPEGVDRVGPATADYAISNMPYRIPNRRHERINAVAHVPVATHRAPGTNQHCFMTECFVDEVAIAGGRDPLEWRLELTSGLDDWQLVLRTLKEKSGFRTDLPRGRGMGVAVVEDHGSISAACATVSVTRSGELTVEKVVIVVDSGHVINPHNAAEQCEGSVCWELTHAWVGGLEMRDGRFVNANFDRYPLLRMPQMPEVEVHFALSGGAKWGGIGEPAGPPVPPAVANAIFFATGKRIRSTPFKHHDLSWS